jgi:Immunity protein 27
MRIDPSEVVLSGRWVLREGRLVADGMCERISTLTGSYLLELGKDVSGWDTLYRDPGDGRFWELVYPESGLHGGGPPQLRWLPIEEARQRYGDLANS